MSETWEKGRREGSSDYPLRVNGHTLAVIVTPEERIVDQIVADHNAARALEVAKKALELLTPIATRIYAGPGMAGVTLGELERARNAGREALALLTPSNPDETGG